MSNHTNSITPCPLCEEKLTLAAPELAKWFRESVKPKNPTAHISWSFRDRDSQEAAFLDGKTRLHFPNSAHNKKPAAALDLFELDLNGRAYWGWKFFRDIADQAAADSAPISWGGHFTHLGDADHFELHIEGESH